MNNKVPQIIYVVVSSERFISIKLQETHPHSWLSFKFLRIGSWSEAVTLCVL
jgi:hypothetical protein